MECVAGIKNSFDRAARNVEQNRDLAGFVEHNHCNKFMYTGAMMAVSEGGVCKKIGLMTVSVVLSFITGPLAVIETIARAIIGGIMYLHAYRTENHSLKERAKEMVVGNLPSIGMGVGISLIIGLLSPIQNILLLVGLSLTREEISYELDRF